MQNLKRGFTLIELLVVIAIIGILAAIVLASLGTARSKGNDARVKEQLNSARNAAEVYYSGAGNYGTNSALGANTNITGTAACNTASSLFLDTASGMAALVTASNYPSGTRLDCNVAASGSAYAISASMSSGYWCVDSVGVSRQISAQLSTTATACPAS